MSRLEQLLYTKASDYVFTQIPTTAPAEIPSPIENGGSYLSVFLRSTRIVDVRKGWSKFYPVVHSYTAIPRTDGRKAEFQVVTSPSRLAELDADHLDNVINVNHRLLGPAPFMGGDINVEIGLFSVKSSDMAKPFLGVLEEMATAAGVAFVSVAKPFTTPLKKGLDLLMGCDDLHLEVGLATTFDKTIAGDFVVMRARRDEQSLDNLKIAPDYKLVDGFGKSIASHPYFIFSIEFSRTRPDWHSIPEISAVHNELYDVVRKGKRTDVGELFSVFKRTALTSPDLLLADAQRLVRTVKNHLEIALPAELTSAPTTEIPPLTAINLF